MADDRAIGYLVRMRDRSSWAVRSQLAGDWRRYDTDIYADEIIAHLGEDGLDFPVSDMSELRTLRRLGGRSRMLISGMFTPDQLLDGIVAERLTRLWLGYDRGGPGMTERLPAPHDAPGEHGGGAHARRGARRHRDRPGVSTCEPV
ncbi:hypothetical protein [Streptomyces sp. NBC_01197]|uniref:hypothetical protein n=1 Tax=Streptomyces sp. NBC_01197 TaxID=2903768 RepID=UPI002E103BAE|nr:hypothetical protein OG452_08905 [Streptomyces sp. NBC_01197]